MDRGCEDCQVEPAEFALGPELREAAAGAAAARWCPACASAHPGTVRAPPATGGGPAADGGGKAKLLGAEGEAASGLPGPVLAVKPGPSARPMQMGAPEAAKLRTKLQRLRKAWQGPDREKMTPKAMVSLVELQQMAAAESKAAHSEVVAGLQREAATLRNEKITLEAATAAERSSYPDDRALLSRCAQKLNGCGLVGWGGMSLPFLDRPLPLGCRCLSLTVHCLWDVAAFP